MEKKYQVFVSSTYEDLQEERQEVIQALLELDCIPSGMELFPAANEDQWTLIKSVIDDCDYYIVIVGGRYGSVGPNGMSYTEMEYRYAMELGKPVIGFLNRKPENLPAKKTEQSEKNRKALAEFRKLVSQKMCQFWTSSVDLGSKVSRSLVKLTKSHPGVGWVRADLIPAEDASKEILELRKKLEELERQLEAAKTEAPSGTEELAQGSDKIILSYTCTGKDPRDENWKITDSFKTTWNEIFFNISPLMIGEVTDMSLKRTLDIFVAEQQEEILEGKKEYKNWSFSNFHLETENFQTIKVQLRALGLITKSIRQRSLKDGATYWTLTPYGDTVMTKLRAIGKLGTAT